MKKILILLMLFTSAAHAQSSDDDLALEAPTPEKAPIENAMENEATEEEEPLFDIELPIGRQNFQVIIRNVEHHDKLKLAEETIRRYPGITYFVLQRASRNLFIYQGRTRGYEETYLEDLDKFIGEYYELEPKILPNGELEIALTWRTEPRK